MKIVLSSNDLSDCNVCDSRMVTSVLLHTTVTRSTIDLICVDVERELARLHRVLNPSCIIILLNFILSNGIQKCLEILMKVIGKLFIQDIVRENHRECNLEIKLNRSVTKDAKEDWSKSLKCASRA